jgi:hypothetical protein
VFARPGPECHDWRVSAWTEDGLIAYVADHCDGVTLTIRDATDPVAALAALEQAAAAIREIPHPDEPDDPLPNWCRAELKDGEPVLHLDFHDYPRYAPRVVEIVRSRLDAAAAGGRLEPKEPSPPPFDYDPAADIFVGDFLDQLDDRGLPPGFPPGFPVPSGATLVIAQRDRDGDWEHAAWRQRAASQPFDPYLESLRAFGITLDGLKNHNRLAFLVAESLGDDGMTGHAIRHPDGTGTVWVRHERVKPQRARPGPPAPSVWYVSVVWKTLRIADRGR